MQKIGIYAGAFDPVHEGHVVFAKEAAEQAGLDRVYFLVEPRPRHKQGVKALEHRAAMVQLAIADEPALGVIMLDQQRFTVHDTWPVLRERFKGAELSMLMGEDVFRRLSYWPRIDEIITEVRFVVGMRAGYADDLHDHLQTLSEIKALHLTYDVFTTHASHHASTNIRAALRQGQTPDGLHPAVVAYIRGNGLYSSESV